MLKKCSLIGLAIIFLAVLAGCAGCPGIGRGSPSAVVKAYYEAVMDGDVDRARGYWHPQYRMFETESYRCPYRWRRIVQSIEILDEEVGGEEAYVTIKLTSSFPQEEIQERRQKVDPWGRPLWSEEMLRELSIPQVGEGKVSLVKFGGEWKITMVWGE